jgi:hypothetical protein
MDHELVHRDNGPAVGRDRVFRRLSRKIADPEHPESLLYWYLTAAGGGPAVITRASPFSSTRGWRAGSAARGATRWSFARWSGTTPPRPLGLVSENRLPDASELALRHEVHDVAGPTLHAGKTYRVDVRRREPRALRHAVHQVFGVSLGKPERVCGVAGACLPAPQPG